MSFKFEKLIVWQKALDLSADINKLTKTFPREETYILSSQIKRAADSVALNIAEGSTGQTNAAFRQFLAYAIRSGVEVISCLYIGKRRELIDQYSFDKHYSKAEEVIRMAQGLRNSLK